MCWFLQGGLYFFVAIEYVFDLCQKRKKKEQEKEKEDAQRWSECRLINMCVIRAYIVCVPGPT